MNLEENSFSEVEPDVTAPRFGIIHLISLTAAIAIYLAVFERFNELTQTDESMNGKSSIMQWLVFPYSYTVISAVPLAGIFWLAEWKRRKGAFVLQPGHWILLIVGLANLLTSLVDLISSEIFGSGFVYSGSPPIQVFLPEIVAGASTLILLGFVIAKTSGAWRSFFVFWAISQVINLLIVFHFWWSFDLSFGWLNGVGTVAAAGTVILFLIALGSDLGKKRKRDWMHWVGVFCLILAATFIVAINTYYAYFYQEIAAQFLEPRS